MLFHLVGAHAVVALQPFASGVARRGSNESGAQDRTGTVGAGTVAPRRRLGGDPASGRSAAPPLPVALLCRRYEEILASACDARVILTEAACIGVPSMQQPPSSATAAAAGSGETAAPEPEARRLAKDVLGHDPQPPSAAAHRHSLSGGGSLLQPWMLPWPGGQLPAQPHAEGRGGAEEGAAKRLFFFKQGDGLEPAAALAWVEEAECSQVTPPDAGAGTDAGSAAGCFRLHVRACALADLRAPAPADPLVASLFAPSLARGKEAPSLSRSTSRASAGGAPEPTLGRDPEADQSEGASIAGITAAEGRFAAPSGVSLALAQQLCDHAVRARGAVFGAALLEGLRAGYAAKVADVRYAASKAEGTHLLRLPIGDLRPSQLALAELQAGVIGALQPEFWPMPCVAGPAASPRPVASPSQSADGLDWQCAAPPAADGLDCFFFALSGAPMLVRVEAASRRLSDASSGSPEERLSEELLSEELRKEMRKEMRNEMRKEMRNERLSHERGAAEAALAGSADASGGTGREAASSAEARFAGGELAREGGEERVAGEERVDLVRGGVSPTLALLPPTPFAAGAIELRAHVLMLPGCDALGNAAPKAVAALATRLRAAAACARLAAIAESWPSLPPSLGGETPDRRCGAVASVLAQLRHLPADRLHEARAATPAPPPSPPTATTTTTKQG